MIIFKDHRGQGNGTKLLLKALHQSYINNGVKTVTLDDMSDNWRDENNIYTRVGLVYISDDGPEMIGNVEEILIKNNML
jgi:hypothetical protein